MSDPIRQLLTGNDVGLFPDEMTTEYVALFRMREIAGLYDQRGEAQKQYAALLLENDHLRTELAVKAEAKKRTALWRMRYEELRDKTEKYQGALRDIGLTVSDPDALRIVGVAFGFTASKLKAWRRATKAKIERQKLRPSNRKRTI